MKVKEVILFPVSEEDENRLEDIQKTMEAIELINASETSEDDTVEWDLNTDSDDKDEPDLDEDGQVKLF